MPTERLRIEVLHGPNLNLLGRREPALYGRRTLEEVDTAIRERANAIDVDVASFQSNSEAALVDRVQRHSASADGWLVNAAAYTHTSLALRDALLASDRPFVEVHLSNVFGRESWRRESTLADIALGVVAGFRVRSYTLGLEGLVAHLRADAGEGDGGSGKPSSR